MHVALTDVLTCPRCGPGHGLILLPEEVRERRVSSGFLGCADCRARYPIRDGVAELVAAEASPVADGEGAGGTRDAAVRLAALLGLADADGVVLLAGPVAEHAGELAALVPGVEVVATLAEAMAGVSTARLGRSLPFQSGRLRGVALTGEAGSLLLEEGARVVGGVSRLLLEPAPDDARARLAAIGLRVVAEEGAAVVAGR